MNASVQFLVRNILVLLSLLASGAAWSRAAESGGSPIASFIGEWSGTANGAGGSSETSDARRYWQEGSLVRGELLTWSGDMRTLHVALVPRGERFLKIVTPDGGQPEYFVGHASAGGIVWTSVGSDATRHLERVVGAGEERRLEVLLPTAPSAAEEWSVVRTLRASRAVLTGVIGDAVPEAKLVEPIVFPTPDELRFFDRLAEVVEQRDRARSESRAPAVRTAVTPVPTAAPVASPDTTAAASKELETLRDTVVDLERRLLETQQWSAGLEASLAAANQRFDDTNRRAAELEARASELQGASSASTAAATAALAAKTSLEARIADMEKRIREIVDARDEATAEAEGLRADLLAGARETAELRQRLEAASSGASEAVSLASELAKSREAHAAARTEADALARRLEALQVDNARLETALAETRGADQSVALGAELEDVRAALLRATEETAAARATIADLRTQLDTVEAARSVFERRVSLLESEAGSSTRALEEKLATAEQQRTKTATELTSANERNVAMQRRVSELEQAAQARTAELASANEKLVALEARMSAALIENRSLEKSLRDEREAKADQAGLVARLAEAEALGAQASTALAEAEDEIGTLGARVAELSASNKTLSDELAVARAKPDVDPATAARLETLEEQMETTRAELAATAARLAERTSENALLESQLAQARDALEQSGGVSSGLEQRLAQTENEIRAAIEKRTEVERELATTRADLALARTESEGARAQIAEVERELSESGTRGAALEADLGAAREHARALEARVAQEQSRIATLERDNAALRVQLEEGLAARPDDRIGELETRLAETFSRAEARDNENNRLRSRIASLEGEAQRLQQRLDGTTTTVAAAAASVRPEEMDELREALARSESERRELETRNGDLAARLRDLEVRLAATSPASRATVASAPPAAPRSTVPAPAVATVPATPAPRSAPLFVPSAPAATEAAPPAGAERVEFRMPPASGGAGTRQAPRRPADPSSFFVASTDAPNAAAAGDPALAQAVRAFSLNGFRRAGADTIVVIGGRVHRMGEVVDAQRGLRFVRIDADALVFADRAGNEYRRGI
jgi:chromosome segregation ATPase